MLLSACDKMVKSNGWQLKMSEEGFETVRINT